MAKRLNYEVGFTAETSELNAVLRKIQSDLSKISLGKMSGTSITSEINEAADAAARLNLALKNAINVDTGRLDLSKFASQLRSSGLTLDQYRLKLNLIGASGTEAFMNVAKVITQAELPLARSNKLLDSLWTTMKNTARWQLTSSALHGFMGGLLTCYGYAQDLNESLNNIRVVTGQSNELMADFARRANDAAKALSSTTTSYTDAALIYYQQGLRAMEDIEGRTNTTIKMANVTKTSAKEVSDQMTAIWNNFYDGSKSLEYYADVITALGAETASSSAEISNGLEKFAAIAGSVGLSYEYATSALATVTATTRQSADIVGNAFKTLFARIQGLNLGETLDDGTTLNKYSEALMKIGINIKDQYGQLKDMDTILDEMAGKWQTLSKDQQLALAQTVAGVRQYNLLVALMDNWDFMQENLQTASGASGTLQKQADIYAESWEAARDRVRAAAEDVYSSIINEDFFIGLDNNIVGVLERIDDVIDTMGGFGGTLITVGTLMTSVYGDRMAQGIRNMAYNVSYLMDIEQARAVELKKAATTQLEQMANDLASPELIGVADAYRRQAEAQIELNDTSKQLTAFLQEQLQQEVQLLNLATQRAVEYGKSTVEARERLEILRDTVAAETQYSQLNFSRNVLRYDNRHGEGAASSMIQTAKDAAGITGLINDGNIDKLINKYAELRERISQISTVNRELSSTTKALQTAQSESSRNVEQLQQKVQALKDRLIELGSSEDGATQDTAEMNQQVRAIIGVLTNLVGLSKDGREALTEMGQAAQTAGINGEKLTTSLKNQELASDKLKARLAELKGTTGDYADQIVGLATTLGQVAMAFNAIKSIGRAFSDEDMDAAERFTTILMSVSMILPIVSNLMKTLTSAEEGLAVASAIASAIEAKKPVEYGASVTAKLAAAVANKILATSEGAVASSGAAATAAIASQLIMMAPYIALLAGVVVGIYALVKAYNADADAAKKAEEVSNDLADAAQEAADRLNNIKSAIDGYDSAVDKLNECTEGTKEWNEALAEVHALIDDIIKKFPELLKEADLFNSDGILNEDVLDRAIQRAEAANQAAQAANLQGQITATQARLKSDTTNAARQYEMYTEGGAYNTGYRDVSFHSVRDDLNKLLEQYDNVGSKALELTDVYEILGNVTDDYAQSMYNLAKSGVDATTMLDNANQMIINTWAESIGEELATGQAQIMAAKLQEYYDAFAKAFEQASGLNNKANNLDYSKLGAAFAGTSFENMSVTEAFNAARGTNYQLAGNGVRGTDNNRSYVYLENGQETEYKMEEMQATVAAAAALEKMGQSADDATTILNNLKDTVGTDIATGIQNYLASGNFESMSQENFDALQASIADAGGVEAYLENALGITGEEIAAILGEDYLDDFTTAANNYAIAFDTFKNGLLKSVQNAYDELDGDTSALSVRGLKAIAQAMEDAMVYAGREGLETVQSTIDALDKDNILGFAEVLESMNWDAQGPLDFIDALDETGVETGLTTEQLEEFGAAMSRINESTDFNSLGEKYANIQKAIKGLTDGGSISAENYEKLGELSEGYFTRMLDGTYKLTTSAEEFQQAIHDQLIQEYKNLRDSYAEERNSLQGISGYDMDRLSQTSLYTNDKGNEIYSTKTLKEQLKILEAMNYNAEELAKWKEDLYDDGDSSMNTKSLQDIANAVANVNKLLGKNGLIDKIDALNGSIYEIDLAIASSYDSFDDLNKAFEEGEFGIKAYNAALFNLDKKLDTLNLNVDEWNSYADHLQDIAKDVDSLSNELADNDEAAKTVAKSIMKMNDGIDSLANGYEDWSDVLLNSSKESEEFADAITSMRNALADVLDISDLFISDDFITLNLDLIKEAATGSAEAIDQLKAVLSEQIIIDIVGVDKLESLPAEIYSQWQWLLDYLANTTFEIGPVNDLAFIDGLNQLIAATDMTVEQVNALCDSLGFEAAYEQDNVEYTLKTPITSTKHVRNVTDWDLYGNPIEWTDEEYPTNTEYVDNTGEYAAFAVDVAADGKVPTPKINGLVKKATGSFNNYSSKNAGGKSPGKSGGKKGGGGGGSAKEDKPKKTNETGLDDILDRYHAINDLIDDIIRSTEKLDLETEKLHGYEKLARLQEEIELLKLQNSLIEEKTRQAKEYLKIDAGTLSATAANLGFTINLDEAGNVLNIEDIQRAMWEKLHAMEVEYNNKATGTEQDKYEEQVLQPWRDKIEAFEKALSLYEETRELIQDLEEESRNILNTINDIRGEAVDIDRSMLEDIIDYYHEINDLIDDATRATKKLNAELKNLRGYEKLNKEKEIISSLETEITLQEELLKLQKERLGSFGAGQMKDLIAAAASLGYLLTEEDFDKNGNLLKADDIMQNLYTRLEKLYDEYDNLEDGMHLEAMYEEEIEQLEKAIQAFKNSLSNYEDTRENIQDTEEKITNLINQIKDIKGIAVEMDETHLEGILDRYHEINDQLDDITRSTLKLNTETNRLYGVQKLANMDKEIRLLKLQNALIEEKTKQAREYLGTLDSGDMGALVAAAKDLGFATEFDAAGNLTNLEEIQRGMYEALHNMEVTYKSFTTGMEQEAFDEEELQPWRDKIDEFERALSLYEETRELIQDLEEERDEIFREIEDIRLNRIVESIEIRLDYKDALKDINELAKVIRLAIGTAYDWGKDVADIDYTNIELEKSKMGEYRSEYQQLMALYEESKSNSAISTADIAEQLETLRGLIIGSAEALVRWAESLETLFPDAIDAARNHFNLFISLLEHNTTIIDTIKEIMVLQGLTLKTALGFNDILDMHKKRMDATLAQTVLNRQWYERAAKQLEEAQVALEAASRDTELYDILKTNRDALLQEFNDAQEAMLASAKGTMEEARNMYVDVVERTAYELEQTLTKGLGFDLLQDKYDHYLDTEERYLDTVNRIYETTTLNNKLQNELDKTTNTAGAAKLRALQEEFKLRQANNKLSQYDIDVMNAKLELTLKQMALEEAQNAKTDLRLVRNAQGNWNYQYTANLDNVNAANQEYLDAMNEYYNLAKNKVTLITGEIIDTWLEMTEKIKEIYEDESLTVEEREAHIAEIREYYTQKVKDLEEEKQKAIVDMTEAGQMAIDDFKDRNHSVLNEMGDDMDNLKGIFSDDLAAILAGADDFNNQFTTDMDDMSAEIQNFGLVFDDIISNMNSAALEYEDIITNVNEEVGTSYDDLKNMLDEVSESTEEITNRGHDEIDMMWDKLDALREITEQYSAMADAILQAADAMRELAAETMGAQFNQIGKVDTNLDYSALIANGLASGKLQYGSDEYNRLMSYRDFAYDERGGVDKGWTNNTDLDKIYAAYAAGNLSGADLDWFNAASSNYKGPYNNNQKDFSDWLKDLGIIPSSLATGGYTGDFENGKLAILHEKELVLNAQDTSNILAAVNTVRNLDSSIWNTVAKNLDSLVAQSVGMMMGRLSSTSIPSSDNQILEQRIVIEHVEFPEATDKNEILEALHSLPDMASQWARIKKD